MEKTPPLKHLGYLDGLRGLAALFVVFHHAFLQVVEMKPTTQLSFRLLQGFFFGRYAVDLFIVLSGFCLMLPIVKGDGNLRGGALKFFQRRAWRILPPYYLALLFSWALAASLVSKKTGTHWDISIPVTTKSVLTHAVLLHDVLGEDSTLNHAFWSIAVEWRIYFLFPVLLWMWRRLGGIGTTFIATVASYLLFFWCRRFEPEGATAYYIGLFTMGMLSTSIALSPAGQYEVWKKLPWKWIAFFATLAVVVVSKAKVRHGEVLPESIRDGVVGLWAMCLLIMVSLTEKGWTYNLLSSRPLVFIGTFAYSIYLIHAPLLQVLWQYVFIPLQTRPLQMFLALSTGGTLLILLVSYLFFLGCERPFLRRKAKTSQPIEVAAALSPAP